MDVQIVHFRRSYSGDRILFHSLGFHSNSFYTLFLPYIGHQISQSWNFTNCLLSAGFGCSLREVKKWCQLLKVSSCLIGKYSLADKKYHLSSNLFPQPSLSFFFSTLSALTVQWAFNEREPLAWLIQSVFNLYSHAVRKFRRHISGSTQRCEE